MKSIVLYINYMNMKAVDQKSQNKQQDTLNLGEPQSPPSNGSFYYWTQKQNSREDHMDYVDRKKEHPKQGRKNKDNKNPVVIKEKTEESKE